MTAKTQFPVDHNGHLIGHVSPEFPMPLHEDPNNTTWRGTISGDKESEVFYSRGAAEWYLFCVAHTRYPELLRK